MRKKLLAGVVMGVLALGMVQVASADLVNGSFEEQAVEPGNYELFLDASQTYTGGSRVIPGWLTTASDHKIEVWSNGFTYGAPGDLVAYDGTQFAELNANEVSTLYQDITGIANGSVVGYQFAHRGHWGTDEMLFAITDLGADGTLGGTGINADNILFSNSYVDGNDKWGFYQGSGITATGNTLRFSYISGPVAGGDPTSGNFLDSAAFGVGVGVVPEPSTYALLCLSLGVVGYARRKMKSNES